MKASSLDTRSRGFLHFFLRTQCHIFSGAPHQADVQQLRTRKEELERENQADAATAVAGEVDPSFASQLNSMDPWIAFFLQLKEFSKPAIHGTVSYSIGIPVVIHSGQLSVIISVA